MSAIPLVLLHGWGAHAGVWGEVIARMALGHAVTAPDFPAPFFWAAGVTRERRSVRRPAKGRVTWPLA